MELKELKKTSEKIQKKSTVIKDKDKKKISRKAKSGTSRIIENNLSMNADKSPSYTFSRKEKSLSSYELKSTHEDVEEASAYESATILKRAVALFMDYLIITLFLAPLLYLSLIDSAMLMQSSEVILFSALLSIVGIVYASAFLIMYQQTFGMLIAGIHTSLAVTMPEKFSRVKYSLLYAGFFSLWIITFINPIMSIFTWTIVFVEILSYNFLGKRTMFEMLSGTKLLQKRRI